jgi:hypothetical protein
MPMQNKCGARKHIHTEYVLLRECCLLVLKSVTSTQQFNTFRI